MAAESSRESQSHTCSVCLELFDKPKVLPCCHTFCLKCLEKTAQRRGEITCPQCRKTHQIPAGGLRELLTDFIATYEVEVADLKFSNPHKQGRAQVCGECEQSGPIRCYCSDCQNYLCEECGLRLHTRLKAYRGHKVIPIEEINAATYQSCKVHYCTVHKSEALKLFCKTCTKLICRDCTLVEHRQHGYTFVEEARKQIEAEMASLREEVEQRLQHFKRNLHEIKKVEMSATGYSEVLKADINAFFDELVRSIEERRKVLLHQAEADCQKDLKQVWADKSFHEIVIAHISSVFGLVDKACKCMSDSEMILTALHSIARLRKLRETEWDSLAFTTTVSSTPTFTEGKQAEIDLFGSVVRDTASLCDIHVEPFNYRLKRRGYDDSTLQANLSSSLQLKVDITVPPGQALVNRRSGEPVNLKSTTPSSLKAVVHYGRSAKELDCTCLSLEEMSDQHHNLPYYYGPYKACASKNRLRCGRIPPPRAARTTAPQQNLPTTGTSYEVTIQPLCGGTHTVTFQFGATKVEQSFTVVGRPMNGAQVQKGPDWKPTVVVAAPTGMHYQATHNSDVIGTVCYHNQQCRGQSSRRQAAYSDLRPSGDIVTVREDSGIIRQYKWGQDGEYEIELAL